MKDLAIQLREASGDLRLATATEKTPSGERWTFKTGKPVKFRFMRNTESSQQFGQQFDQEYEPFGTFVLSDNSAAYKNPLPKWIYGWAQFRNPLVVEHITTRGEGGWKRRVSQHFGAKGKDLSRELIKAGYDAVVTINKKFGEASEMVALKKSWRLKEGVQKEEKSRGDGLKDVQPIPKGDCFRQAAKYAMKHDGDVVHGTVKTPTAPRPFLHAWVEKGNKVFDPTIGVGIRTKPMTRKRYYELLDVDYRQNLVYPADKAIGLAAITRHWGPWTRKEWQALFGGKWEPGESRRP